MKKPREEKPPAGLTSKEKPPRTKNLGKVYSYPMGVWFTIFFVAPLAIIILYSFLKKGLYGGVIKEFSLTAYKQIFDPAYGMILIRTIWISVIATFITILLALPCGYA